MSSEEEYEGDFDVIDREDYTTRSEGVPSTCTRITCTGIPVEKEQKVLADGSHDFFELGDSGRLLRKYIQSEGFSAHHIEVYDNWTKHSSFQSVCGRPLMFSNGHRLMFENLVIFSPRYTKDGKVLPLTPKLAREQGASYSSDWHVDVVHRDANGEEIDRKPSVCIASVPTMLKSSKCILRGKSDKELTLLGEDPRDPGGYFIVVGSEKVVLLREMLSLNKIFLMDTGGKGSSSTRMTVSTHRGTSLIELVLDKKTRSIIKIRLPSLRKPREPIRKEKKKDAQPIEKSDKPKIRSINVLRVLRILGLGTIEEIKRTVSLFITADSRKCLLKLTDSIVEAEVITDDVGVIAKKTGKTGGPEALKTNAEKIIEVDVFPHLNDSLGPNGETDEEKKERVRKSKIYLLCIMIARLLENLAGFRDLDNRDSWSNKRAVGAGRLMEQLFRGAWRKIVINLQGDIDENRVTDIGSAVEKLRTSFITDVFRDSFVTSKWGVKRNRVKNNVSQPLMRENNIATLSHLRTLDVEIDRKNKRQNLRVVQNTQWGFVCPASTPEGQNSGLLKNLGITAKTSLNCDDSIIVRYLIGDTKKGIVRKVFLDERMRTKYPNPLIVNASFLGWCKGPSVQRFLLKMRRTCRLPRDMSVIFENDILYVDSSPCRLVRPLLVVDENQELIIDRLDARGKTIYELLANGSMEYISPWEQEYIKLATGVDSIRKRKELIQNAIDRRDSMKAIADSYKKRIDKTRTKEEVAQYKQHVLNQKSAQEDMDRILNENKPYTHCELDPLAILAIAAALIPWPNHNQAPRNTYQVSMGKQALGEYHSNHQNRFDGKTKVLAFAERPTVETEMYDLAGLTENGPGMNINIAFMCFPYTEEDAFIMKKEFLDNGGFRIYKYLTYKTIVKQSGTSIETLTKPKLRESEPEERYKYIQMRHVGDPSNGLPMIGAYLRQGDCVIGKEQTITGTQKVRNESVILRFGDEGIVEKVSVTSDHRETTVIVKLRVMRVPEEGDKFAPRNAQKGTVGLVMSDVDMPFDEQGIVPDMIINPHSIPTRMTMEYPMEIHAAKYAALKGTRINATAFRPFEINKYREVLKSRGRDEFGYENMRSGTSGEKMDAQIFSGPVFFQALKHHVKDKFQARGFGQVKPMTRQAPSGRGNRGGLRFGEMERDSAISHGASAFLRERLMMAADAYQTSFCKVCGIFAVDDATGGYEVCRLCGNSTEFGKSTIPYVYKLLIHLLAGMGINLRPDFVSEKEYAEDILTSHLEELSMDDIRRGIAETDLIRDRELKEFIDSP